MIANTVLVPHAGIDGCKCYVDAAPEKRTEVMILAPYVMRW